jgi:hypothetical protein
MVEKPYGVKAMLTSEEVPGLLEGITDTGAIIVDREGKRDTALCDTVVLSLGVTRRTDLIRMLENLAPEVHVIGDCRRERGNLWHATTDGFNAAMEI